jgi:acyl-CoA thioesterase-1
VLSCLSGLVRDAALRLALVAAILVPGLGACALTDDTVPRSSATASAPAGTTVPATAEVGGLRYVALGDSYTIGTSVEAAERFPDQLVAALGPEEPTLTLVANLATNGFTSRDVIDVELPALDTYQPEFVTLLIGVNDVVQGVPLATYETNVVTILDALLARLPAERIVVVAIPEYTVTPQGANYGDPLVQRAAIQASNAAMERLAAAREIRYVDIYDISLEAEDDRSLVADDGLHPSGAQYARWVERLLPVVEAAIGR